MIGLVVIADLESNLNRMQDLVSSCADFKVLGYGRDGYDALKLVSTLRPDVVVLDLDQYAEGSGIAGLLKRKSPGTSIIIFTASEQEEYIRRIISADVSGYLLKENDMEMLPVSVRMVISYGCFVSPRIAGKALTMLSAMIRDNSSRYSQEKKGMIFPPNISRTEIKVIGFLAQGWSDKEIAENLQLATGTVRNCISATIQKAGLRNRTQVALFALKNGLGAS